MNDLGYVEGRDFTIDTRWAGSRYDRIAALAAEVTASNPAVIVTASSAAVAALKNATSSVPIVFATAAHPVEQGIVSSMRRPGGNITGIALHVEIEAKLVELITESLPAAQRLGVLVFESAPIYKVYLNVIETTAKRFRLEPVIARVARFEDTEHALKDLANRKADALLLPNQTILADRRLAALALKARLPLFSGFDFLTDAGGLLSYGTQLTENYQRASALVDKILRGAKPADLPVEQPNRFRLVVSLKTANTLGITLPPAIMLRADRVIE
jgi:putative ABC transport system substrate-binding protein